MAKEDNFNKEATVKVLQYISDHMAEWKYAPIDPTGKIKIGNQTWSIVKATPDYLCYSIKGRRQKKEPFFILRNDLAVPVNIKVDEQATTPVELNQLIDNVNLKALTKIDPAEVDYKRMLIFGFIMFFVGFGLCFILRMFGLL